MMEANIFFQTDNLDSAFAKMLEGYFEGIIHFKNLEYLDGLIQNSGAPSLVIINEIFDKEQCLEQIEQFRAKVENFNIPIFLIDEGFDSIQASKLKNNSSIKA